MPHIKRPPLFKDRFFPFHVEMGCGTVCRVRWTVCRVRWTACRVRWTACRVRWTVCRVRWTVRWSVVSHYVCTQLHFFTTTCIIMVRTLQKPPSLPPPTSSHFSSYPHHHNMQILYLIPGRAGYRTHISKKINACTYSTSQNKVPLVYS